jgi:hypothetical protein
MLQPGGVGSAGDHEVIVDLAVGGSAGAPFESHIADRTVLRDEPEHGILRAIQDGNCQQGILRGLDPPAFGCAWQERHWFELKRGPRPLFAPLVTAST